MKTSDKILTFMAIFISCLALVVSIMQTRIMQKQSQAAVWPRLTNSNSYGADYFKIYIENEGVGPAIVKSITYRYADTSFHLISDLAYYIAKLESEEIQKSVKTNYTLSNIEPNSVVAVGEKVDVFVANDSLATHLGKKYLLKSDIIVDYCSIYDVCWRMENDKTEAL